MERSHIKEVLRDVFGRNFEMKDLGSWVSIKCPLAPWTHSKGSDSSASAGVKVEPDGTSIYNCFTCKHPKPFHAMLRQYAEFSGDNLDDLIEELEEGEFLGPARPPSYDSLKEQAAEEVLMPLDEGLYMDIYAPAGKHPYLRERGISLATSQKLELRFDPGDRQDKEPRILFPVRGPDGLLYGFSGRAINKKAKLKVRDYHGLKKSELVLGAHLVKPTDDVLAVEGLFDYANAHQCGYAGCAVMHSTMTDAQAEIFRDLGRPTYLFYDDDEAGDGGNEIAERKLKGHVPVLSVVYPDIKIEDDSPQGWHWLKDPGEMIPEDFAQMIRDAYLL